MILHYPTVADRALAAWRTKKFRTVELAVQSLKVSYATAHSANWVKPSLRFIFDDDTELQVSGKGKSHRVEALLP